MTQLEADSGYPGRTSSHVITLNLFGRAGLLFALVLAAFSGTCGTRAEAIRVELVQTNHGWQLRRAGSPYFIKGAGGEGSLAALKDAGANSIRTWGGDRIQAVLDEAQKLGLTVCVGIWLHHEHDTEGFDYSNPAMVKQQLEDVRQSVLRYKDHPAVLLWGVGNEMEGEHGDKIEIWKAVNDAARLVKQLDTNHPTMTVLAELGGARVPNLHKLCPDVDIVGINSYAGASSIAERYPKLGGTKPYIITEFGPPGRWESAKTPWNAAYELTSTEKAGRYRAAYRGSIEGKPLCLGSYAFLWGEKQEGTATWFGMFLKDGARLQAVDMMTELWTGHPPAQRCPVIQQLKLRGKPELEPGTVFRAELSAADPAGQPLRVRWVVQPEQMKPLTAGAAEELLPELTSIILQGDLQHAEVRAPEQPGGYRLFAYVYNPAGAAVANVPFHVAARP